MAAYDQDTYIWTREQSALIRSLEIPGLDCENVAEEIESLGRDLKRRCLSNLCWLLMEFLLFKYLLPDDNGKRRTNAGIELGRLELLSFIDESPSLINAVNQERQECYAHATVMAAARYYSLVIEDFPRKCPFSMEQILDENFFPE